MCGFAKTVYYFYQAWWTDKDFAHIAPHWNWKGKEGQPVLVWVNTNAENVELFLNGKSQGKKDMPAMTTGEAERIVITPVRTGLPADGAAATIMNVTVVDKNGKDVPDAVQKSRGQADCRVSTHAPFWGATFGCDRGFIQRIYSIA